MIKHLGVKLGQRATFAEKEIRDSLQAIFLQPQGMTVMHTKFEQPHSARLSCGARSRATGFACYGACQLSQN